ncbi:MAG TPA: VIT1/CCC1 transporter family protein [Trueperaceae bacterium]
MTATTLERRELLEHRQDEADTAYIYESIAATTREPEVRSLLESLAREEGAHRRQFEERLAAVPEFRPSPRARFLVAVARLLGERLVLALLRLEEGREVARFLRLAQSGVDEPWLRQLARESAAHARALGRLTGVRSDPWHHNEAGGMVRNVVYGFNDGLTANFGLIAGVIGASVSREIILLTGFSGLVASAFSMAASGYLAAQSQREVDENELNTQRTELLLWPEQEESYLAGVYRERGLSEEEARVAAERVMSDPEVALQELAKEKLGIGEAGESPIREGVTTGVATVFGALVPIVPFFFGGGAWAVAASFLVAMAAHFLVGAARSALTGRNWFRSGFDMFVVGLGVAAAGYLVGYLLTGILPAG